MAKKAKKSVKVIKSAKPVKKAVKTQKKTKPVSTAKKAASDKSKIKVKGKAKENMKVKEKEREKKKVLKVEIKAVKKAEKKIVKNDKKADMKADMKIVKEVQRVGQPAVLELPVKVKRAGRQPSVKVKKIRKVFTPFNPIQPASASGKPVNTTKKEPKGRFELEYVIRCSEPLLYDFISSPSGLSEWFSDNVNIRDGIYTFYWDGSEQKARLLALKEEEFIRYQWMDKSDGSFFEFKIVTDDLTGDVSLIIVDFADSEEEQLSSRLLWDAQVDKLKKTIGSHT